MVCSEQNIEMRRHATACCLPEAKLWSCHERVKPSLPMRRSSSTVRRSSQGDVGCRPKRTPDGAAARKLEIMHSYYGWRSICVRAAVMAASLEPVPPIHPMTHGARSASWFTPPGARVQAGCAGDLGHIKTPSASRTGCGSRCCGEMRFRPRRHELLLLWEGSISRAKAGQGYGYSRFCDLCAACKGAEFVYGAHHGQVQSYVHPSVRHERLFVDYASSTVDRVIDYAITCALKMRTAQIFPIRDSTAWSRPLQPDLCCEALLDVQGLAREPASTWLPRQRASSPLLRWRHAVRWCATISSRASLRQLWSATSPASTRGPATPTCVGRTMARRIVRADTGAQTARQGKESRLRFNSSQRLLVLAQAFCGIGEFFSLAELNAPADRRNSLTVLKHPSGCAICGNAVARALLPRRLGAHQQLADLMLPTDATWPLNGAAAVRASTTRNIEVSWTTGIPCHPG